MTMEGHLRFVELGDESNRPVVSANSKGMRSTSCLGADFFRTFLCPPKKGARPWVREPTFSIYFSS